MSKLAALGFLALLIIPTAAQASSVNVNVNSNTSSNQTSTNRLDNNTHIRININGEVKEYTGSDGNIDIKSGDGKTSVSVKNNEAGSKSTTYTSDINNKTNIVVNSNTKETSPSASHAPEATVAGIFKDNQIEMNMDLGFWERLTRRINAIFESIF